MRAWMTCVVSLFIVCSACAQCLENKDNEWRYKGFVELGIGAAYNLNTAQTLSTVNMQTLWTVATSHGVTHKNWFGGLGFGYHHSLRDKEDMYLTYGDVRYCFQRCKLQPLIGLKGGIIFDPYWIEKVQMYGALSASLQVYKRLRIGLEGSAFSRPSRHFTANGALVVSYDF